MDNNDTNNEIQQFKNILKEYRDLISDTHQKYLDIEKYSAEIQKYKLLETTYSERLFMLEGLLKLIREKASINANLLESRISKKQQNEYTEQLKSINKSLISYLTDSGKIEDIVSINDKIQQNTTDMNKTIGLIDGINQQITDTNDKIAQNTTKLNDIYSNYAKLADKKYIVNILDDIYRKYSVRILQGDWCQNNTEKCIEGINNYLTNKGGKKSRRKRATKRRRRRTNRRRR